MRSKLQHNLPRPSRPDVDGQAIHWCKYRLCRILLLMLVALVMLICFWVVGSNLFRSLSYLQFDIVNAYL
jgi:hypothetical protein